MRSCIYCGTQWEEGEVCPNCQRAVYAPAQCQAQENSGKSDSVWIVIALIGGFVVLLAAAVCVTLIGVFNSVKTVTRPVDPQHGYESRAEEYSPYESTPADPEGDREGNLAFQREKGVFVSGFYEIGKDVPAGEYAAVSNGNTPTRDFYLGVYTSSSQSEESELIGGWYQGCKLLVLEEGQYIELVHANLYDMEKHENPSDPFRSSGMYKVGRDLEAGTYTVMNYSDQYTGHYTIYSSINCIAPITREGDMVSSGATAQIELYEGDYIEMKFCCLKP